jgi:GT2 family glycosyltransferase
MMPFYGRFDYFQAAVDSVRAQSDPDWRLVVIDDVYPDRTPGQWLVGLADSRIEYIRNETNLGVSGNFRKSAELATASFAVIMGCDDVMLPNYVEHVSRLARDFPESAIIQPGVRVIDENGEPAMPLGDRIKSLLRLRGETPRIVGGDELAASLLRGNWTYFPSLCWNTKYLRKHEFREEYDVVLDLALQLEVFMHGGCMLLDDQVCFLYRRHSSSVSSWKATDGTRFVQEATLFAETQRDAHALGWRRSERTARSHLTSRLNALTKLPQALRSDNPEDRKLLVRHVIERTPRRVSGSR